MSVRVELPESLRARVVGLDELDAIDAPVVVACSGGADSLTLLAVALDHGLRAVAVHVDHGLRDGSDREADVVADAAARLGAAFDGVRVDVGDGPGLEARARVARYAALDAAAERHAASAILVGHTADDQAETVLLAILRGSAGPGLAAMPVRRERAGRPVVRPLLRLRRAETEACVAALGLEPVRDPSNDDRSFRRAWVRHEALPLLAAGAGRDLVPVLVRQADVLRDESDYLDSLARTAWPSSPDDTRADVLARLTRPLARRAVRCWLGGPPPSFDEVERVLAVADGSVRATEIAGGRRVARTGGRLVVRPAGRRTDPPR